MVDSDNTANDVGVSDHAGTVVDPAVAAIHDVSAGKQSGYPAISTGLLAEIDFTAVNRRDGGAGDSVCVRQSAIRQHGP